MYYYYSPPKSSIWGHSLRKMLPSIEFERVSAFLKKIGAVEEKNLFTMILSEFAINGNEGQSNTKDFKKEILTKIEITDVNPKKWYYQINKEQYEIVLQYFIENEYEIMSARNQIILSKSISITEWIINDQRVKTRSTIDINYGNQPRIGTSLIFNDESEFEWMASEMLFYKLCKLNKKHLRLCKGEYK